MSSSKSYARSLGPLSVGNVVSAAIRIYRDRFLVYYKLAFIAYLWLFIPIYGWAKFLAISGLISRLAYQEVIEAPETVTQARRQINARLWNFLITSILVGLIMLLLMIAFGIILIIGGGIIGFLLGNLPFNSDIIGVILGFVGIILWSLFYTWLYSRMLLAEVPIAVENFADPTQSIDRSWQLTKGLIGRIMLIFFIALLISIPISAVIQVISVILQAISAILVETDLPIFNLINFILLFLISIGGGAFLMPFWQAIKAVIYYDLRTRQEGIDLELGKS